MNEHAWPAERFEARAVAVVPECAVPAGYGRQERGGSLECDSSVAGDAHLERRERIRVGHEVDGGNGVSPEGEGERDAHDAARRPRCSRHAADECRLGGSSVGREEARDGRCTANVRRACSMLRHNRATTVVSHPPRFSTAALSARLTRSQVS